MFAKQGEGGTVHTNEERIRRFYEHIAARDVSAITEMLNVDVIAHVPGTGVLAGDYQGREAFMELALRALAETDGTFKIDPIDILANDRYAVVLQRWTAQRKGRHVDMKNFNLYRFDADGMIAERWEIIEDDRSRDAFWA
jgi:hypothetical protein